MAIFSGKVVQARFLDNPNNMNIEVIYKENDENIVYNIEVDFSNDTFNELLQEITLEEIEAQTKAVMDAEFNWLNAIVVEEVAQRWTQEEKKIKKAYDDVDAYAKKQFEVFEQYEAEQKAQRIAEFEEYINSETKKRYESVDKYIDAQTKKQYESADAYAEDQKTIKFQEVKEEMRKYRDELQSKFNTDEVIATKEVSASELISILHEKNTDNDFVFNTKIAILEDPNIAKTKDKSLKLAIRKAKTLQELIGTYTSLKV